MEFRPGAIFDAVACWTRPRGARLHPSHFGMRQWEQRQEDEDEAAKKEDDGRSPLDRWRDQAVEINYRRPFFRVLRAIPLSEPALNLSGIEFNHKEFHLVCTAFQKDILPGVFGLQCVPLPRNVSRDPGTSPPPALAPSARPNPPSVLFLLTHPPFCWTVWWTWTSRPAA